MPAVVITYPQGYQSTSNWEHSKDLFCPSCGKQDVWVEEGSGDYYVGNEHICASCAVQFTIPTLSDIQEGETFHQALTQIREPK
jgi:hypothetical protein